MGIHFRFTKITKKLIIQRYNYINSHTFVNEIAVSFVLDSDKLEKKEKIHYRLKKSRTSFSRSIGKTPESGGKKKRARARAPIDIPDE